MTWDEVLQKIRELESRIEELEGKQKVARGSRLPNDFIVPQEWLRWGIEQGYGMDFLTHEASNFADYWTSASGKTARKVDWKRTWMRWVRTSASRKNIKQTKIAEDAMYGI